ncbi:MAG TPA: kelch repeat-containing protein [Candidatus Acidoferrum sp.]|nr:kelch repeat-containing protein [Candidatus Acidoferrum sp.]
MKHWRTHSKSARIAGEQGLECHEPPLGRSAEFVQINAIRVSASPAFASIRVHSWFRPSTLAWPASLLVAGMLICLCQPAAAGSWLSVATKPAGNIGEMLLLPDGTVMCADDSGNPWYRLTPDQFGSYANGQWSTTKPMNYPRNLFAADVVQDGRLFVAGGEYGTGITNAEIYDPQNDHWTVINPPTSLFDPAETNVFSDMISIVIPDGTVLMAPLKPKTFGGTLIYDPRSNLWSDGPVLQGVRSQGECGWAKLPDGSILTIDKCSQTSQRYIPSLGKWLLDSPVPQFIWNTSPHGTGNPGCEIGPVLTLPSGQVFFAAGTGSNALYTPSGGTNPGTWSNPGPLTPNDLLAADAPGAVMINGKLLFMVATNCFNGGCNPPWHFYEYDYAAKSNAMKEVAGPPSGLANNLFIPFMLDLPDGTILLSGHTPQLSIYVPDPPASPIGQPTITSITANPDGSFHLIGTGLNGITEGANEGDDGQMASDYPLVRLTNLATGKVYYARTYNWSSTRIQTGSTPVSTEFKVSTDLPPATYSLVVVANGVPSDPVNFYGPVWVDFNTAVHPGNGTYATPYDTLAGGMSAVSAGGTIFIKPGSSTETPAITKPMTIVAFGGQASVGH